MRGLTLIRCTLVASAALVSATAAAGTATNTMTSIATVTDACDIVAVGLDFGITSLPLPATGIISATPNTSAGNAVSGNSLHPNAANDGGAGNDDELALSTPDATTTGLIATVLGTISTAASGVFVACTTTPTSISVTSGAAGATPYSLPTTVGGSPSGTFAGKMGGVGGGAGGSNALDYTITFVGTPVSTAIVGGLPVTIFTAAFLGTGTVPATQGGTVVPGYYADVATAQVDF
jgi:hypothetical protein